MRAESPGAAEVRLAVTAGALLLPDPFARVERLARDAYRRQRTEWGGLLWGLHFRHPASRALVPLVVAATDGLCDATATTCAIRPESRAAGLAELPRLDLAGWPPLDCVGDWHAHPPRLGVYLSYLDRTAYWAQAVRAPWLSLIVDPWSTSADAFAHIGAGRLDRVPWRIVPAPLWPLAQAAAAQPTEEASP